MRLWRRTGVIHTVGDPPACSLPAFEHAPAIAARIAQMRVDYAAKMEGWYTRALIQHFYLEWDGEPPTPQLPQLPWHYFMAWPLDEPGAPPKDERTTAYDARRAGSVTMTVVDEEPFPDGIDFDVPKPRNWSASSDDSE